MSYEGRDEYLCGAGHYWSVDASVWAYGDKLERMKATTCSLCGRRPKFHCSIDCTNGYDQDDPATFEGGVIDAGEVDIPHRDHRGNRYVSLEKLYKPDFREPHRWRPFTKDVITFIAFFTEVMKFLQELKLQELEFTDEDTAKHLAQFVECDYNPAYFQRIYLTTLFKPGDLTPRSKKQVQEDPHYRELIALIDKFYVGELEPWTPAEV